MRSGKELSKFGFQARNQVPPRSKKQLADNDSHRDDRVRSRNSDGKQQEDGRLDSDGDPGPSALIRFP
jgi:hypothetical protein